MDKKILAILAIIVVVVAAAAAAFVVLGDDDDDKDSDYTILDSNENIKEGLTFKITSETPSEGKSVETSVVKSITEGVATLEITEKNSVDNDLPFEDVMDVVYFDLANPPEGIDVITEGNTVKINGKMIIDETHGDEHSVGFMEYRDFKVDIVDGNVTKASGKIVMDVKMTTADVETYKMHTEVTVSSNDTNAHIKGSGNSWEITKCSVGSVYEYVLEKRSYMFTSATWTKISESESFGNITASSYSVKGNCYEYGNPADLTVIVYKDFILSIEGKDVKYKVEMY